MKISVVALLIIVLYAAGCAVSVKQGKNITPEFSVTFGKTGGFTNLNPSYTVNSGGEVFKRENSKSAAHLVRKISAVQTDSIWRMLNDSRFMDLKINLLSNITNFIEVNHKSLKNKIQWRDETQIPPAVQKLNSYLLSLINN